jgi:hypothetical protein
MDENNKRYRLRDTGCVTNQIRIKPAVFFGHPASGIMHQSIDCKPATTDN